MGLLDSMDDPRTMGLLSLGMGMLNSRGNFGQALGQAGPQALEAVRQVQQDKQKRAQQEQMQKMQQLQMQQAQMAIAEQQRATQERERMSALAQQFSRSPQQMAMANGQGPTVGNAAAAQTAPPGFDFSGYANALAGIDPVKALAVQQSLRKEQPKLSKLEQMRGPDGRMVNVAVFEDGTSKVLPYGVKPEIALQNLGNRVVAIDKNDTGNGASFATGTSPDTIYQGGITTRGQNLTNARAGEANQINKDAARVQIINDPTQGILLVDKGNGLTRPARTMDGKAVPSEKSAADRRNAQSALDLVTSAESVVPDATGSIAGDLFDRAAAAIAVSTSGAQGTAKLKTIEGALLAKMPRMEGPQSNIDVANYKAAAGQIGDPWVPRKTKLAALETVKEIQQRYAGGGTDTPSDIADIMNKYRKP
jgi:hypothetical protein